MSEVEWRVCYLLRSFNPCHSNVFQCFVHEIDSIILKAVVGRFSQTILKFFKATRQTTENVLF